MVATTYMSKGRWRNLDLTLKSFARLSCLALLTGTFPLALSAMPAFAQDEPRQFSSRAGEPVSEAVAAAEAGNFETAITQLQTALNLPDLSAFERASIYQMLGQYNYELDRLSPALLAFENAVASNGFLPEEIYHLEIVIAKLMIANGDIRDGAQRLEARLTSVSQPASGDIDILLKAWIQAEEYKRALPWAERWFSTANPRTREHFDVMNFLYNNLGQTEKQAQLVKQMIQRWPEDETLWHSWASMLANSGKEADAFEVTKMLYLGGALSEEKDLLKIVQYYSFYDMPYQAAEILEREMEAKRIAPTSDRLLQLSDLFRQAREYKRAIPILEIAARQSGAAKPYADWGEALYNEGTCEAAEEAFTEAVNRGYDAGKSWMLVANCQYDRTAKMERLHCGMSEAEVARAPITQARAKAIQTFRKVPKNSREYRNAQKWISFVEAEKTAFDRRCDFEITTEISMCMGNIERAYDAVFLTGEFELDDAEQCQQYVAEYDAKYRNQGE